MNFVFWFTFYWGCFNISIIGAILAGVSVNHQLMEKRHDLYLVKEEFPNTDYASKIINGIKFLLVCLCPFLHLYTAWYVIFKWDEFTDDTYKKVVEALEFKKREVRENINSGNFYN